MPRNKWPPPASTLIFSTLGPLWSECINFLSSEGVGDNWLKQNSASHDKNVQRERVPPSGTVTQVLAPFLWLSVCSAICGQLLAFEFKGLQQFSASHPHNTPSSTRELLFSKSSKVLSFI